MSDFYGNMRPEDAERVDGLTKLAFEFRENRLLLLKRHGVENEAELAGKISSGEVDEHRAYEDYLGAGVLSEAKEAIRDELRQYLLEINAHGFAS
jgi:hypothetical protein